MIAVDGSRETALITDGADMGVAELGDHARFPLETLGKVSVGDLRRVLAATVGAS